MNQNLYTQKRNKLKFPQLFGTKIYAYNKFTGLIKVNLWPRLIYIARSPYIPYL